MDSKTAQEHWKSLSQICLNRMKCSSENRKMFIRQPATRSRFLHFHHLCSYLSNPILIDVD